MNKQTINPSEYTKFDVLIHKNLNDSVRLPCDSYESATKLFRTLMLSKDHNYIISIMAHPIIEKHKDGTMTIATAQTLIKAQTLWDGKGPSNDKKHYKWRLLEDSIGYDQLWHLLDGSF